MGNPLGTNDSTCPGHRRRLVTTNTAANASLRVPYLGFAPGGLISGTTDGDDKFNSLQATVRKRLSHGLTLQAAYTWSKSLATGTLQTNDANQLRITVWAESLPTTRSGWRSTIAGTCPLATQKD